MLPVQQPEWLSDGCQATQAEPWRAPIRYIFQSGGLVRHASQLLIVLPRFQLFYAGIYFYLNRCVLLPFKVIPVQVCTILDSLQPNTTVTFKVTLYMINVVITFQQYTLLTHCYTYFNSLFYFRARPHYVNHQSIINHSLLTQLPGPALLVYDGCCRALYGPLA